MIHNLHLLLPFTAIVLSIMACGGSRLPAAPTTVSLFASQPAATTSPATLFAPTESSTALPMTSATEAQLPTKPEFTVSVIVDKTTQQVSREQAQAVIAEASKFLQEFSPYGITMVDYAEDSNGGSVSDIATRYLMTRSAFPPNGLVVFSYGDNEQAKASGGYGFNMPLNSPFNNPFASPSAGDRALYVAVVDHSYKYMACGYGGSETVQSATSLAGECRGQVEVACVSNNGYSMCSNAVGNLYTSTPTHEVSSMVVHGLLHNFGAAGENDDYAAPECSARMGYPAGFFDLQESEYYNGLCPYVYEEFTKSYRP